MTEENKGKVNKKIVAAGLTIILLGGGVTGAIYLNDKHESTSPKAENKLKQTLLQKRVDDNLPNKKKKSKEKEKTFLEKVVSGDYDSVNNWMDTYTSDSSSSIEKRTQAKQVALAAIANLSTEKEDTAKITETTTLGQEATPIIALPTTDVPEKTEEVPVPLPTPMPDNGGNTDDGSSDLPDTPTYAYPVLEAMNMELHVGDSFQPLDNVKATDALDGDITNQVKVIQNNVNVQEEGVYQIRYQVTNQHGLQTELEIQVTVVNDAPTIYAENQVISLQQPYSPLEGISATDTEDGDITSSIRVTENNVQIDKEGTYTVTFSVVDRHGKETMKTIQVQVVNDAPVIQAENQVIEVGDTFSPLQYVSATDKQDGDLSSQIEVIQNEVNTQLAGKYQVTYRVIDQQGKVTTKTITITVRGANTVPILEVPLAITTNVGVAPDWLLGVKATDAEDGDITDMIKVDVNQVDLNTPGTYTAVYSIKDSAGETVEKTVLVHVETPDEATPF
ncbi:immunoglobulin-like domain-containing protein [Listeria seeligeri]|nr:immunoglobulin-like domain-containing protein [Listeria seeligeri]MBC1746914.1 DUF5011 domain-containing protein [Listeria seeligeri]MBC1817187.1 DUF5011 domain-containing protein [Listeria seeligeri]MBF2626117.1 DUF5011 domain-containing protein [Listeria seeligeri]MBF2673489.1 DUF5011 domain-containing protein [Listeria seeligeri]